MTQANVKALSALEVMKSCHDFDSTVSLESLATIQKHFSIPNEYVLHAPRPRQRPCHPCLEGFSVYIDALEARLRFPLHPIIEECLEWWRISPSQVVPNSWCYLITFLGECKGSGIIPTRDLFLLCFRLCMGQGSYCLTSRAAPTLTPRVESRSPSEVQKIPTKETTRASEEEARGAPEVPIKRRAMDLAGQRKKSKDFGWHRLHHEADRSAYRAAKGKGPAGPVEETPTPKSKSRSVKELCSACPKVDGWDYHTIRMSSLPERALDAPLEMDLAPVTYGAGIWLDREASKIYPSHVETELLELTRSKDALWTDPSRQAIKDYKKSPGFEMGLVQMGRLSLEYRYQLELVRLRARHPGLEIEQDHFALLPEDADVPMADEQPFDDSPSPPEE
ncbi:hypothetical protein B296_00009104 [Ensete ventricosum]|uniref:Transposase (putative) gypsy type domain-containing protein n=1 Tax=Ensete ventricosum TaxID=4639 RepID=A0A426ZS50_ENSVE|nr:hypothetical protein B296_00009104 [Ensete ventricosum]